MRGCRPAAHRPFTAVRIMQSSNRTSEFFEDPRASAWPSSHHGPMTPMHIPPSHTNPEQQSELVVQPERNTGRQHEWSVPQIAFPLQQ
jgi:hypothetical protein